VLLSISQFKFDNAYPSDDRAYAMAAAKVGDANTAIDMLLKPAVATRSTNITARVVLVLTSLSCRLLSDLHAGEQPAAVRCGHDGGRWDAGNFTWPRGFAMRAEGFPRLL